MFKGDQINHRIYPINWVVYRRFDDLNRYKNQEETREQIQINIRNVLKVFRYIFFILFSSRGLHLLLIILFLNIYLTFGYPPYITQ